MQFTNEIFSFSKKNTNVYIIPNNINLTTDAASIQLLDGEKDTYVALKTDKRKKEFLLVRYLRNIFFPGQEIKYTETGAPYFKNHSLSLSISHTSDLVGIATSSEKRLGLDIEKIQEKINRIAIKFMHFDELTRNNELNETLYYTYIWCGKEAIYKWSNIEGLSFINELTITKTETGAWFGKSIRISQNPISLEMIKFRDHVLCFTY